MEMASEPVGYKIRSKGVDSREDSDEKYISATRHGNFGDKTSDVDQREWDWLRRSLFSYLNFCGPRHNSVAKKVPKLRPLYTLQSLPFDYWESPDEDCYSKLTMVNHCIFHVTWNGLTN